MAKTFGIFMLGMVLGLMGCGVSWAQAPSTGGLPAVEPVDPDQPEALPEMPSSESSLAAPSAEDVLKRLELDESSEAKAELEFPASQYDMWDLHPALFESSGTWLRRGFWYTEVDAVIYNRFYQRRETIYATDIAGGIITASDTFRLLQLYGDEPGAEASARFTLGRFLFRDMCNRDHSVEFTAFGGGEWLQSGFTEARVPSAQRLNVPIDIDLNNLSFDGAASMSIAYASQFNSFEANYLVRSRMQRDRMVMDPTGEWVRQASPSFIREFLVGLRYFDLRETVNWQAFDFSGAPNSTGSYVINTDNDLFGFQGGAAFRYEQGRWSIGINTKLGVYFNDIEAEARFARSDMEDADFNLEDLETSLSFIGQTGIMAKWHLRPNLSLRAGWEFLYVTSVALAPDQINFRPDELKVVYTGDPFYNGAVFGLEGYW